MSPLSVPPRVQPSRHSTNNRNSSHTSRKVRSIYQLYNPIIKEKKITFYITAEPPDQPKRRPKYIRNLMCLLTYILWVSNFGMSGVPRIFALQNTNNTNISVIKPFYQQRPMENIHCRVHTSSFTSTKRNTHNPHNRKQNLRHTYKTNKLNFFISDQPKCSNTAHLYGVQPSFIRHLWKRQQYDEALQVLTLCLTVHLSYIQE